MSHNTVYVTAAPGCRVPREGNPRAYYPGHGEQPAAVERTPHVERLLLTGDLVESVPYAAAADFAQEA